MWCLRCLTDQHNTKYCPSGGSWVGIPQTPAEANVRGQGSRTGGGVLRCYCCGLNPSDGHNPLACPFRHPTSLEIRGACWNCGERGHNAMDCIRNSGRYNAIYAVQLRPYDRPSEFRGRDKCNLCALNCAAGAIHECKIEEIRCVRCQQYGHGLWNCRT